MKTDQNKQRTIKNNGCEEDMKNKTTSIIDIIIKEIDNLMEQATKEKSHYYVKSVLEKCKSVIKLQSEEIKILWKHNRQRAEEIAKLHIYGDTYKKDYHDMKDERDDLKKELKQCQDCSGYCLYLKQEIKILKEKNYEY